jgi:putative membrane protein
MTRSLRMALVLLTLSALAGCVVPQPTAPSPAPATPAAPEATPAPPGGPTAASDQDFFNQATGLNNSEIGMGRLAHGKGAAKPLRLFAQRMVVEHTEFNHRLAALAKHLGLELAPTPDNPPPDLLTTIGPDFDRHYVDLVNKGHQDLIALYESEAEGGQDVRVKHLAREVLAMLRVHLKEGEALAQKLGIAGT